MPGCLASCLQHQADVAKYANYKPHGQLAVRCAILAVFSELTPAGRRLRSPVSRPIGASRGGAHCQKVGLISHTYVDSY